MWKKDRSPDFSVRRRCSHADFRFGVNLWLFCAWVHLRSAVDSFSMNCVSIVGKIVCLLCWNSPFYFSHFGFSRIFFFVNWVLSMFCILPSKTTRSISSFFHLLIVERAYASWLKALWSPCTSSVHLVVCLQYNFHISFKAWTYVPFRTVCNTVEMLVCVASVTAYLWSLLAGV